MTAHTAIHAQKTWHPNSSILIFGIELLNDASGGCNDTDFAAARAGRPITSVGRNVCDSRELPDVGALAAIHLEHARRRTELQHQGIDVLSDELVAQSSNNFLLGSRAICNIERSLSQ